MQIRARLLSAALLAGLCGLTAAPATAQTRPCADLAISGTGEPGTRLGFKFAGHLPDAPVFLVLGDTAGRTHINFGALGTLDLGIARPFVIVHIGRTDARGILVLVVEVPRHIQPAAVLAQGVAVAAVRMPHPHLEFCVSDVEHFRVGPRR